jgi:hypothetical protein
MSLSKLTDFFFILSTFLKLNSMISVRSFNDNALIFDLFAFNKSEINPYVSLFVELFITNQSVPRHFSNHQNIYLCGHIDVTTIYLHGNVYTPVQYMLVLYSFRIHHICLPSVGYMRVFIRQ